VLVCLLLIVFHDVVYFQAKHDKNSSWLTLELRSDRAYQTFTKAVFANVRNLCVLCGDAMQVLPAHFPASVMTNLFVNHPEPPQQTGGRGESQSKHLLDEVQWLPLGFAMLSVLAVF
jgi:hypothetical protein